MNVKRNALRYTNDLFSFLLLFFFLHGSTFFPIRNIYVCVARRVDCLCGRLNIDFSWRENCIISRVFVGELVSNTSSLSRRQQNGFRLMIQFVKQHSLMRNEMLTPSIQYNLDKFARAIKLHSMQSCSRTSTVHVARKQSRVQPDFIVNGKMFYRHDRNNREKLTGVFCLSLSLALRALEMNGVSSGSWLNGFHFSLAHYLVAITYFVSMSVHVAGNEVGNGKRTRK